VENLSLPAPYFWLF